MEPIEEDTAQVMPEDEMAASEEESEAVQTDEMDQWKPEENKAETEEQQNTAKPMSREMKNTLAAAVENVLAEQAAASEEPEKPEKPSQSGLGITQDLAKEITQSLRRRRESS